MALPSELDLTNVLSPTWEDLGIRIDLHWRLRLGGPSSWGADISKRRMTKSGRNEGKPEHIVLLMADPGDSPSTLLRRVADILEMTEPIPVNAPSTDP